MRQSTQRCGEATALRRPRSPLPPALERRRACLLLLAVLLLAILATGCASSGPKGLIEPGELERILERRGLLDETVIPYGLTAEMKAWAHKVAPTHLSVEQRMENLRQRLLLGEERPLEYTWGYTGTAQEVFASRQANCLAFTNLFVGMAREVGVPLFFLSVEDIETYRKEGDLVVISDHIAVGIETSFEIKMYDFSEHGMQEQASVRRISDLTALSMFHSNRGAEELQRGNEEAALQWLRTAVQLDPTLANAWVNLGVVLRRRGETEHAELAYTTALEVDPRAMSAYQNLVSMLRLQGREDEAASYERVLRRSPNRNPFTYMNLGDLSQSHGKLDEARRFYRRATQLNPQDAEAHAALGHVAFEQGNLRLARKMLRKARELDAEETRTVDLQRLLEGDN